MIETTATSQIETLTPALKRPELLAPAGNWACARAAVEAGADAIYFGLDSFNARMRADNFRVSDLPELMAFLHERGVKGYLTLNTLVFEDELASARSVLVDVVKAGVDAAIVQDVGVCRLIRQISADFPIHASTQMTVTSAAGVRFADELGVQLVVLARECSIKEIKSIQTELTAEGEGRSPMVMPLEVFVHGALCVAYSGQCLTSEALGGRSANRGECAQACRMTYDLYRDGERVDLGDRRYLLSPQDLLGLEAIPELIQAGVSSFKIEGRLKTPEYVANVTSAYRRAIDASFAAASAEAHDGGERLEDIVEHSRYDLEMAFSRGLYSGWLHGIDNQSLVHARFGKKRGVYVGRVVRRTHQSILLEVEANAGLKEGDGLVIDQGRPDQKEQGGRVYRLRPAKVGRRQKVDSAKLVEVSFRPGALSYDRVQIGDRVWKTNDPDFDRRWQRIAQTQKPLYRRGISLSVTGKLGEPLEVEARDDLGHEVRVSSDAVLEEARSRPLNREILEQQLGRLGGTPLELVSLETKLPNTLILPVSELNRVRRKVVEKLTALRKRPLEWNCRPESFTPIDRHDEGNVGNPAPQLLVLVRTMAQLETVLDLGVREIYCDFEDPKAYRAAVQRYRSLVASEDAAENTNDGIFVAPPRIHKSDETWVLKQVKSCEPDGFLVRNYDHLNYFRGARLRGDFSFNVANSLTAQYFRSKYELERVTASYDLNTEQLEALLKGAPPTWFEVTIHQHMPMFHMEHCVFCTFLSKGKDYRDCGRPCDKHEVELVDRVGQRHALKADVGCRNTVYNGRAQTGADYYSRLVMMGVRAFRVEFVNESDAEVRQILECYRQLQRGELSGEALWQKLKLVNQLGVTRGTMRV